MIRWIFINNEKTKYLISSDGYVLSTCYKGDEREIRRLKHNPDSDGYMIITLNHNGIKYTRKIHRLVAEAFIPNPLNLPEVNHKDGDKKNNQSSNLEWCTTVDNIHHALEHNLRHHKTSFESVREVCELLEKNVMTMPEISSKTGVDISAVRKIYYGKNWRSISKDYDFSNYNKRHSEKGENNAFAKITDNTARTICELLIKGKTTKEISDTLNVSINTVRNIRGKRGWTHISKDYDF